MHLEQCNSSSLINVNDDQSIFAVRCHSFLFFSPFSSHILTFSGGEHALGAGYYCSTREFDITIPRITVLEKLTARRPPFTYPSSVTFVTSRLHYANVGIEGEKLGYNIARLVYYR